jgi:hypothetical protein
MDSVDGPVVRVSWSALEPADDVFSWTRVDEAFAAAPDVRRNANGHVTATAPSAHEADPATSRGTTSDPPRLLRAACERASESAKLVPWLVTDVRERT